MENRKNDHFYIIALAASAGGLSALTEVLSTLPASFPAAVTVVLHLDPRYRSHLADILSRDCQLSVRTAEDGLLLEPGWVFVAPPNFHLMVNVNGSLSLDQSKTVHFVRPSANRLFESLADCFTDRVIAVVLTGSGRDGREGVIAVKRHGGRVIAQDETTSQHFGMPSEAIATGSVDWVLPLSDIAPVLVRLVNEEQVQLGKKPE